MRLSRTGVALVALSASVAVSTWPGVPAAAGSLAGDDFPRALLGLGELALAALAGWLLLVALGGVLQVRVPGVPRLVRAALFTAVVVGVAAPAHADGRHDLTGLPLPDRPVVTAVTTPPPTAAPTTTTVRAGDTLWAIATRSLPDDASTADVAEACRDWHRANRSVIGADPDLIRPGQELHPPREDPS